MLSNGLLTDMVPFSREALVEHDRAALEIVTEWQSDPSFSRIQGTLDIMLKRLTSFVSRAAQEPE